MKERDPSQLPDDPPPKPCCNKLLGVLETKPRLVFEAKIFDVPVFLSVTIESAR